MAMSLADAITKLENVNPAYNNPGAISGTGDTGQSFGQNLGIYSSLSTGQAALNKQINSILSGKSPLYPSTMTVQDMGTLYSGGNPDYGNNLANMVGVSPSTTLGQLSNSNGIWSSIKDKLNQGMNKLDAVTGAPNKDNPNGFVLPSIQNAVFIILGIIFIGVGLSMFKTSQTIITTAVSTAKKGLELAA